MSACPEAGRRHEVADVLHLPGDPARYVVDAHDVAHRLVPLPALLAAYGQALVDGFRGGLDIERVDREDMWLKLLMGAGVLGEDDHTFGPVHKRAFLDDQVQPV